MGNGVMGGPGSEKTRTDGDGRCEHQRTEEPTLAVDGSGLAEDSSHSSAADDATEVGAPRDGGRKDDPEDQQHGDDRRPERSVQRCASAMEVDGRRGADAERGSRGAGVEGVDRFDQQGHRFTNPYVAMRHHCPTAMAAALRARLRSIPIAWLLHTGAPVITAATHRPTQTATTSTTAKTRSLRT